MQQILAQKLQQKNYKIINNKDDIIVKLPMFSSIKIHIKNGQITTSGRFGYVQMIVGLIIDILISISLAIAISFDTHMPLLFKIVIVELCVWAILWDYKRYKIVKIAELDIQSINVK